MYEISTHVNVARQQRGIGMDSHVDGRRRVRGKLTKKDREPLAPLVGRERNIPPNKRRGRSGTRD